MKLRVFVIDDEESIRLSLKWHLEDQGHEVMAAPEPMLCDIYQGHDCHEAHSCGDILFVDFNMPRMNGLEFLEKMRARGCKGDPRNKIIMSGATTAIDMERIERIGCQALQKPILLEKIDVLIEECKERISASRHLADLTFKKAG